MKKYVLLVGLLFSTMLVRAQGQLGIQLSPSIAFNSVYTSPNNAGLSSAGASLKFKLGVIYDHPIRDNYYVSTGLLFVSQQASIKKKTPSPVIKENHHLQYLQVPILLKLYTSEIALDTRVYTKFGVIGQFKLNHATNLEEGKAPLVEKFRFWGASVLIGVGVEYDTSLSTSLFGGISYQYGLTNVIKEQKESFAMPKAICHNDLISIDLGVRF